MEGGKRRRVNEAHRGGLAEFAYSANRPDNLLRQPAGVAYGQTLVRSSASSLRKQTRVQHAWSTEPPTEVSALTAPSLLRIADDVWSCAATRQIRWDAMQRGCADRFGVRQVGAGGALTRQQPDSALCKSGGVGWLANGRRATAASRQCVPKCAHQLIQNTRLVG